MQRQESRAQTYQAIRLHLTNVVHATETSRAETQLRLAERKMGELESNLLMDPQVTEEQICEAVAFKRDPLWRQAANRIQIFAEQYSFSAVA